MGLVIFLPSREIEIGNIRIKRSRLNYLLEEFISDNNLSGLDLREVEKIRRRLLGGDSDYISKSYLFKDLEVCALRYL